MPRPWYASPTVKATSAMLGIVLVADESRIRHHQVRRLRRSSPRRSGRHNPPRTDTPSGSWWESASTGIADTASRWRIRPGHARCARCRRATPAANTSSVPSRICYRYGRDERRQALARDSHQFVHHARQFEQRGEGLTSANPAGQPFGRDHCRGARCVPQQGDLADDDARRQLSDGGHAIGAGVRDLRPSVLGWRDRRPRVRPGASTPVRAPRSTAATAPPAAPTPRSGSRRKLSSPASSSARTAVNPATSRGYGAVVTAGKEVRHTVELRGFEPLTYSMRTSQRGRLVNQAVLVVQRIRRSNGWL